MKDSIIKVSEQISNFIQPYWDKILHFLNAEYYVVYAAIAILLVILLVAGLFTMLKRTPKLLFLVIFLLGIAVALWYVFVKK